MVSFRFTARKAGRQKSIPTITQDRAHEVFQYLDGELYIRDSRDPNRIGMNASHLGKDYMRVCADGKRFKTHRIVFLLFHGYLPDYVDHIDGNKWNNRIENLRACEQSQNGANRKQRNKNNTSGYRGVRLDTRRGKWLAQIMVKRKNNFLGYFPTPEDAAKAYDEASRLHFGEFASLNFPEEP